MTDQQIEDAARIECPVGNPDPLWACRFCGVRVHSGDDICPCSEYRPSTRYASLCFECAEALDVLTADTRVGRIHRALVYEANCAGRPTSD